MQTKLSRKLTLKPNITSIGKAVEKLWPFCISRMAASLHLGFLKFESCIIRSADPENPTPEQNIMYISMLYTAGVIAIV